MIPRSNRFTCLAHIIKFAFLNFELLLIKYHICFRSLSTLAGACVMLEALPEKLNPIIKPLMESIKHEKEERLQNNSANILACLVKQCITREPCPNSKIISNLCTLLCSDPDFTPKLVSFLIKL